MTKDCYSPAELALHPNDLCILDDRKIPEFGRIIEMKEMHDGDKPRVSMPVILRRATLQDQSRAHENAVVGHMAIASCRKRVTELKLDMRVMRARYSFDRSALTVTFCAEERIDFRELVRALSQELSCRIEMKQLGVRDAAGIIGGVALCGRKLCCCSWLKTFDAVGVKMAKAQRLSLSPGTISGMCGRLKCCLRYEYDAYRHLNQHMPKDRSRVDTPMGRGIVIDQNVLTRIAKVLLDDHRIVDFNADQLSAIHEQGARAPSQETEE